MDNGIIIFNNYLFAQYIMEIKRNCFLNFNFIKKPIIKIN